MSNRPPPTWRQAKATDLPAIETLLTQAGLPLEGVADHWESFLVICEDDRLQGAIGMEAYRSAGLLRSAVVAPEVRGQGLGTLLVCELLNQAKERGLASVLLLTETAQRYFAGFGFRAIAREQVPPEVMASEEFRGACPVSATVMEKVLPQERCP